ncbi:MAG: hypothetical protein COA49_08885 [Bacteroidetes bacterium]|nr:MAG: hypothetical protein COA49_08885 [Bacteroidota bacterium]
MKNIIKGAIIFTISIASFTSVLAQGPDEYWIGLEEYAVHTEGELAGMTTWRMYLHMLDVNDFLSACTGITENPWILESTSTPAWYQHPSASEVFATAINPAFFTAFPNLEFDSWFTIGAENSYSDIEILALPDPTYDAFTAFEAGENVYANTQIGNAWVTLYPGLGASSPGFAGNDLKVLMAQITTSGTLSGSFYVQIFPWGIQDPDVRLLLPVLYAPTQCMDLEACNYDDSAWMNDECEYGPSAGVIVGDENVDLQGTITEWSYSCDEGAENYLWTADGGTIISGQGTSSILVEWSGTSTTGSVSVIASNSGNCEGQASVMNVDILLGIEQINHDLGVSIFPNPASSEISLSFTSELIRPNYVCKIFSSTGSKVQEFTISTKTTSIDVSGYSNGTYILLVQTQNGIVRESFIVAKQD